MTETGLEPSSDFQSKLPCATRLVSCPVTWGEEKRGWVGCGKASPRSRQGKDPGPLAGERLRVSLRKPHGDKTHVKYFLEGR